MVTSFQQLCLLVYPALENRCFSYTLSFDSFREKYEFFEPSPGGYIHSNHTDHTTLPVLDIPIFSDIKGLVEPMCRGKWLFIFSSPNPSRYKETMKNYPKFEYILPTWHYLELKFIDAFDNNWIERFIQFGGVPRSIFGGALEEDKKLIKTLVAKGGMIADYFFKHGFGNVEPETSYTLLHMNPPWSPVNNDWLYQASAVYSFASDAIFQKIAEKHKTRLLAEPINLFNAGVAPDVYGGGSAGNLFEKICLWLKPVAGNEIMIETIDLPKDFITLKLPLTSILQYHWKENARNDPSKKLQPGVLYQPKIANLESGDSFCVLQRGYGTDGQPVFWIVILQITVGENHPVKVNGLHDIILAFPEHIQHRIVQKLLVFVTPLDGKLNSLQPLHTQDNKVAQIIPKLVRGFQQCVCRLAL